MKLVTVKDDICGTIRLAEEYIDAVRKPDGSWKGTNAEQLNRMQDKLGGMITWPKQILDVVFSDDKGKARLEAIKPVDKKDPRDISNHKELAKGNIMPVFAVNIIALPGTRIQARYLHEIM